MGVSVGIVGAFIAGIILATIISTKGATTSPSIKSARIDKFVESTNFLPAIVLLCVSAAFAVGIAYVNEKQVLSDDTKTKRMGVQNIVGMAWGLFIIAAFLIPYSLQSASISLDSKYYLIAALFTFYFSTLVAEVIIINQVYNLPSDIKSIDLTRTYNLQGGLFICVVAYGVAGLLML